MYKIGDLVIYGNTGVCRIENIGPLAKVPSGKKDSERLYYTLKPLYQECVISAPVDSDKVFMRPIITKEEAEQLIDKIPSICAEAYHNRVLRQLEEHYTEAIKSHSCEDLVMLTMSIYAKKKCMEEQKRKFGAIDERYMKRGEDLLFGELAAALGIKRDEVSAYIENRTGRIG